MGGKPKSKASALASAEVRRLWEEPAEETSQNQRSSVGILSLQGEEDVNEKLGEQKQSVGWMARSVVQIKISRTTRLGSQGRVTSLNRSCSIKEQDFGTGDCVVGVGVVLKRTAARPRWNDCETVADRAEPSWIRRGKMSMKPKQLEKNKKAICRLTLKALG